MEACGAVRSGYIDFELLNSIEKTSYILGSEI